MTSEFVGEEQRPRITVGSGTARKRFVLNIGSNMAYLGLSGIFGLWFTPYLLNHLGVDAYGFVPLAASVTVYMSILTTASNSAIGRFLTIDLVNRDSVAANRTFNTALHVLALLAIILLVVVVVVSLVSTRVFNVPLGLDADVRWLFLFTGVAFVVGVAGNIFAVPAFSYNRFDLQNAVKVLRLIVLAACTVAMFAVFRARLWLVGMATFLATIVSLGGYLVLWRQLAPELKIRIGSFDHTRFRELLGMGSWVVINQVGTLLFVNIDLIVVNVILGTETAGRYGSVLQLSVLLRSVSHALAGVLAPILIAHYAQNSFDRMTRVSSQAVKLLGIAMALPIGLLCGLAKPLLTVWLGPSFADLDVLLIVLLGHLSLNLAVLPLFSLQTSTNRVRWPGIVSLLMGLANLGLATAWAMWGQWGAIGVAAAGAVVLTAKNAFFTPVYTAHIFKLRWWTFVPSMLVGVVGAASVWLLTAGLGRVYLPNTWLGLMTTAAVVTALYAVGAYLLALTPADRKLIESITIRRIRS